MRVVASAPAKLVILGEYVVLEGAAALVMAVDRRVEAHVEPSGDGRWHLESDLEGHEAVRGTWGALRAVAAGGDARRAWVRLPVAVIEDALRGAGAESSAPARVRLTSRALYEDGGRVKLGLGSSAAIVVALGAALRRGLTRDGSAEEDAEAEAAFGRDLRRHGAWQGGRGSGVDVAASTYGGVLAYRRATDGTEVVPVDWPAGLVHAALWTGTPASTPERLKRVDAFRRRAPEVCARRLDALRALAERGRDAWVGGRGATFLDVVRAWQEGLRALDRDGDIGIVSPAHDHLANIAAASGAAYKPSGAGGGDLGLMFASSPETLAESVCKATEAGYRLVPLRVDPRGVRVHPPRT